MAASQMVSLFSLSALSGLQRKIYMYVLTHSNIAPRITPLCAATKIWTRFTESIINPFPAWRPRLLLVSALWVKNVHCCKQDIHIIQGVSLQSAWTKNAHFILRQFLKEFLNQKFHFVLWCGNKLVFSFMCGLYGRHSLSGIHVLQLVAEIESINHELMGRGGWGGAAPVPNIKWNGKENKKSVPADFS